MACNIERPDPQDLFNRYRDMFSSTVLGGAAVVPESNEWYAVALQYAMAEEFWALSDQAFKERDPRQACDDNLVAMAANDGVYPYDAIAAQGYVKITGTPGCALPTPLEFTIDGQEFITAVEGNQPTALNDDGEAVVRVRAVNPGAEGNVTTDTGTLTTTVACANTTVEVCTGSFCGGADAESATAFRNRYINRLQFQPRATVGWMEAKFAEWPCVSRATLRGGNCCQCSSCGSAPTIGGADDCEDCRCEDCGGKMDFYVFFENDTGHKLQTREVLDEIQEWMFGSPQGYGLGQVPMGICGRVLAFETVPVNVTVTLLDCAVPSQLNQIETLVREYFTTVEPSKLVSTNDILLTLYRVLGSTNVNVDMELVDPSLGYGPNGSGTVAEGAHVYVTECGLEPDCDYMITLNDVTISSASATTVGGCP